MTDDSPPDDPPKPKRRRKPPPGVDTGYPDDAADSEGGSSAVPKKQLWGESGPEPSAPAPEAAPAAAPRGETAPVESAAIEASQPAGSSLAYPAYPRDTAISTPIPVPIPASASGWAAESGPTSRPGSPPEAPAAVTGPAPAAALAMEPLPPALATTTTDLREAVGARPERRSRPRTPVPDASGDGLDDDLAADGTRRPRRLVLVSAASLVVGLGVAALVFLGRANSSSFYISCQADQIVAQRGRAFPPWGESTIEGKQWAPIKIPPEAECIALETEDEAQLSEQFRTLLVKRASVLLTAKEVTQTDEATRLLEQALLHARANSDAARDARAEIQRLLGDVAYWRASLQMRDASKALLEAAKQFDAAAQLRPRHVTDASAWADYVRKVVDELAAGPAGSPQPGFPPAPPSEHRPPAPPGVALPVEPDVGDASEPATPPPDAALPTGGVLL